MNIRELSTAENIFAKIVGTIMWAGGGVDFQREFALPFSGGKRICLTGYKGTLNSIEFLQSKGTAIDQFDRRFHLTEPCKGPFGLPHELSDLDTETPFSSTPKSLISKGKPTPEELESLSDLLSANKATLAKTMLEKVATMGLADKTAVANILLEEVKKNVKDLELQHEGLISGKNGLVSGPRSKTALDKVAALDSADKAIIANKLLDELTNIDDLRNDAKNKVKDLEISVDKASQTSNPRKGSVASSAEVPKTKGSEPAIDDDGIDM